ncbi:hypothetical protein ACFYW6_28100 [Streptomyces sp. NPDC002659]|uniref:hypothetical protein n=1 Tax=Streptomyces sp. NPDC002659 TaxID=3364656 RepID=UPI0036816E63
MDLGEGVEEPLVAEAEALVAKRQRGTHRTHGSSSSSSAARQLTSATGQLALSTTMSKTTPDHSTIRQESHSMITLGNGT